MRDMFLQLPYIPYIHFALSLSSVFLTIDSSMFTLSCSACWCSFVALHFLKLPIYLLVSIYRLCIFARTRVATAKKFEHFQLSCYSSKMTICNFPPIVKKIINIMDGNFFLQTDLAIYLCIFSQHFANH